MLFKLNDDDISELKNQFTHAFDALQFLVKEKFGSKKVISYPSIKYSNADDSWREFSLCFHEARQKHYANLLRPKYKGGKTHLRPI